MLSLIALGSNSSDSLAENARRVARAMRVLPGRVVARSRLYRTPAWPPGNGADFVNAVISLQSPESPEALLARLHAVEAWFGRRRHRRWAPRRLDLDLLAWGHGGVRPDSLTLRKWMALDAARQTTLAPDRLILPHPRLQDRAFVLIPLHDIAPDWRHPVTGRTVRAMVAALDTRKRREIRPIGQVGGVVNGIMRSYTPLSAP